MRGIKAVGLHTGQQIVSGMAAAELHTGRRMVRGIKAVGLHTGQQIVSGMAAELHTGAADGEGDHGGGVTYRGGGW